MKELDKTGYEDKNLHFHKLTEVKFYEKRGHHFI